MGRHEEIERRLMATFQVELEEHLGTLNKGLLALEQGPAQEEREPLLAELSRAAHSVKGAARAVNLRDIETVSHGLEDALGAMKRGELPCTPGLFDALFSTVDALKEAMAAHLRDETLPAEKRDRVLKSLQAAVQGETAQAAEPEIPQPALPISQSRAPQSGGPQPEDETIRVSTAKLDALTAGMGELVVARMRTEQRLAELRTVHERMTRLQAGWRQVRPLHTRRRRQDGQNSEIVASLLDFLTDSVNHLKEISNETNNLHRRCTADYGHLSALTDDLQDVARRVRMAPISTLFAPFPRMVRDLGREREVEVSLQVEGAETEVDRQVMETMKDPLTHLLRNAVDHGIEPPEQREKMGKPRRSTIHLRAAQMGNTITLEVADDGKGIDPEAVRQSAVDRGFLTPQEADGLGTREMLDLVFHSGLSTQTEVTELSGRGVGLDVVRTNLERLQGLVKVDTALGRGTTFTLTLPLTMATSHVLLVEAAEQTVAVPTTTVERILRVDATSVGSIEGRAAIRVNGHPLPLVNLTQLLELPATKEPLARDQRLHVVVLGVAEKRIACRVDGVRGTQEVVIKSLGRRLSRVRNVAGASILGSGQVVMILNVADLMESARAGTAASVLPAVKEPEAIRRRVLVVDDSITTRTLEKNILESAGYTVPVAADGEEAWILVQSTPLDAIVADVSMPRMDGFALTEKVKGDDRFKDLPVVLVTALDSPEDKVRGLEAGADAYITKGAFDQRELLETIERLIG